MKDDMHRHDEKHGFTLLELAIVLTVIALIAGGITLGQEVVKNSRLQSITADVSAYKNAMRLFKDKYKDLPGDLSNATSFWGEDSNCPNTAANHTPKKETCDGNGDGTIAYGNPYAFNTDYRESWRAWQQLANAGFISGQYIGTGSSLTGGLQESGLNMPASKFTKGAGFTLAYSTYGTHTHSGTPVSYSAKYGHILVFGFGNNRVLFVHASGPILTSREAALVDAKADDGQPSTGNVLTYRESSYQPDCTDGSTPPQYDKQSTSPNATCALIFITGF